MAIETRCEKVSHVKFSRFHGSKEGWIKFLGHLFLCFAMKKKKRKKSRYIFSLFLFQCEGLIEIVLAFSILFCERLESHKIGILG